MCGEQECVGSSPRVARGRAHSHTAGTLVGGSVTYHVHTTPDLVSAKENWAPHSIWHTPWPFSLSMFWGTLQPSLPPRPSFPKSPSPQENTKPRFKEKVLQPSVSQCPHPSRDGESGQGPTFVSQGQGLCISAPTGNLDDSVAQKDFHLFNHKWKNKLAWALEIGRG